MSLLAPPSTTTPCGGTPGVPFAARGAQRVLLAAAVGVLGGLGVTGCSTGTAERLAGCPEGGWDGAVLWSSETERNSHVSFVSGESVVHDATIPGYGLIPSPNVGNAIDGDVTSFVANGDPQSSQTGIVRIDRSSCTAGVIRGEEARISFVAAVGDHFLTEDSLNLDSNLSLKDVDGTVAATRTFPDRHYTVAREYGESVFLAGTEASDTGDRTILTEIAADDLAEVGSAELPGVSYVGDLVIVDGRLVLSQNVTVSGEHEVEGTALTVIDPASKESRDIPLEDPAPNGLVPVGDSVYVAHNFMNPSFRDLSEYRTVSRVDLTTGESQTFDVGAGLLDIAAQGTDTLLVLNATGDDDGSVTLTPYSLPDMTPGQAVTIAPPGDGYYYPAGILTPASQPASTAATEHP